MPGEPGWTGGRGEDVVAGIERLKQMKRRVSSGCKQTMAANLSLNLWTDGLLPTWKAHLVINV